jgi:hypothetical protein
VGESVTLRDQAVQRRCSLVKVTVAGSGFFHQQLSFPLWDDGTLAPCLHHTPPPRPPQPPPNRCRPNFARRQGAVIRRLAVRFRNIPALLSAAGAGNDMPRTILLSCTSMLISGRTDPSPRKPEKRACSSPSRLALSWYFETVPCRVSGRACSSFLKLGVLHAARRVSARSHGNCGPRPDEQIRRSSGDRFDTTDPASQQPLALEKSIPSGFLSPGPLGESVTR